MAEKKRSNDEDYKKNQTAAQNTWTEKNPDYWRKYRENNPHYAERNRQLQKIRNLRAKHRLKIQNAKIDEIAKMDEYEKKNDLISGYYTIYPIHVDRFAKMDGMLVKIDVITKS